MNEEELTVAELPEPVAVEPAVEEPKAKAKKTTSDLPASEPGQAVTGDVDEVLVSKCLYKAVERKSLSVHHLQRRLAECGHRVVLKDRDGWLADNTVKGLRDFQAAQGLKVTGDADLATLQALFANDPNVVVVNS